MFRNYFLFFAIDICFLYPISASYRDNNLLVSLEVTEYSNHKDVNHKGEKCEFFHYTDRCDPRFKICLTNNASQTNCNIFEEYKSAVRNKKYISEIFKGSKEINGQLSNLNPWYLTIDIWDADDMKTDSVIATFHKKIQIETTQIVKEKMFNFHGVRISVKISISCNHYWHTKDCSFYCKDVPNNYYCKPSSHTVRKICIHQCHNNGKCKYQPQKELYICNCPPYTYGDKCEIGPILPNEKMTTPHTVSFSTISATNRSILNSNTKRTIATTTYRTGTISTNKIFKRQRNAAMSQQNNNDEIAPNELISKNWIILICGSLTVLVISVSVIIVLLVKLSANAKNKAQKEILNSTIYYDGRFNNAIYGVSYPEENVYEQTVEKRDSGDYEEL